MASQFLSAIFLSAVQAFLPAGRYGWQIWNSCNSCFFVAIATLTLFLYQTGLCRLKFIIWHKKHWAESMKQQSSWNGFAVFIGDFSLSSSSVPACRMLQRSAALPSPQEVTGECQAMPAGRCGWQIWNSCNYVSSLQLQLWFYFISNWIDTA